MLRAALVLATALGCFGLAALAQPGVEKKVDAGKGKEEPGKGKAKEAGKDVPKGKVPLDKLKFPKDAIVVVVDDLLEALSHSAKMVLLTPQQYQDLIDQIDALKRQLKVDKKVPSTCKLFGKLEGDFLVFRAEYLFSTEQPNTTVVLGLQGGHLTAEEGSLGGKAPILDYTAEEGFGVRVEKEGARHELTLHFRVPVQVKKSSSGAIERGIKLDLPGAAVTVVDLELPGSVKELIWNDTLEKSKTPGRWVIGMEKSKVLNLTWKEPVALAGNAPLAMVEGQIKAEIGETHVNISADLFLEDRRLQTKVWRLLLPIDAVVEVKVPRGLAPKLTAPTGKSPYHLVELAEPTAERLQVTVESRVPRPGLNKPVAIGPFHVIGAYQQQGTITVTMPAKAHVGQRLAFIRNGDTKLLKNMETEALFRYVADKNFKGTPKAPLELEWRFEKNQLQTQVDHSIKVQPASHGWELDVSTRIKVNALFSTLSFIDLKLPQPRPRGLALIGSAAPDIGFPAGFPWGGLWHPSGMPLTFASQDDFSVSDDTGKRLDLAPLDANGSMRVILDRVPPIKQLTILVKNSYRAPAYSRRLRLELPRPLNTQDRPAKLTMQADKHIELLHGPEGAEEPYPDRHQVELPFEPLSGPVDLAWRPYQREVIVTSTLDISLHEHSARVQQTLTIPRDSFGPGADARGAQIAMKVPRGIDKVLVTSGGESSLESVSGQTLLLRLKFDGADRDKVLLEYDLPLVKKVLNVTPIWPHKASQQDVKVRVWCPTGVTSRLAADLIVRGLWKERSIEVVPGKDQFPVQVLQGFGANLPLTLEIEEIGSSALAAFLADRALIQVRMMEDGSQQVQARYWIRKIHATYVDVELPLALSRFHDLPTVIFGLKTLGYDKLEATETMIRVKMPRDLVPVPEVLEITYTIPADGIDENRAWRTTLYAPTFRSAVVIGQMRWQFSAPTPMIAASLEPQARADVQWALQGWLLTPEPAVTSADLESWLTGGKSAQSAMSVTYAFSHVQMQPETVYHLPRTWWLLGCSGLLLVLTLGGYFSPLPRRVYLALILGLALAFLALGVYCPAIMPPLLFGVQPGVALFIVFVGAHQLLQERYRRQLVFLPGFSRTKATSVVNRGSSAKRPRVESTVDVPAGTADGSTPKSGGAAPGS